MIRLVTLDDYEPPVLKQLTKVLYTAFGVGAEHTGSVALPAGFGEPLSPHALLAALPKVQAFADDKVLFLTAKKLAPRKLLSGETPTYGVSQYSQQLALVSSAQVKGLEENVDTLARYALQEVGHCYGLHHCLDPRCSMFPQWTPSYPEGDAIFCVFCREQSEQRIRLTKS
ncbi:MAG: hypothetical protein JNG84_13030 [Archangium sp.]|nr:hypothetical protein [Archangium sp.]